MLFVFSVAVCGALVGAGLGLVLKDGLSPIMRLLLVIGGFFIAGVIAYSANPSISKTANDNKELSGLNDVVDQPSQEGVQEALPKAAQERAPTQEASSAILLSVLAEKDKAFLERMISEPDAENLNADEYAFTVGIPEALSYLPRASDAALVTLIEGQALTTEHLLKTNPQICYQWLYGGFGYEDFDFTAFADAVGAQILKLQFVLHARMVESSGEVIPAYDEQVATTSVSQANFQMLQVAGVENTGLITGDYGPRGDTDSKQQDYQRACTARIALYQALLNDPFGASAIRHLYIQSKQ